MASVIIGKVKSGKSKRSIEVKWNQSSRDVYVKWAGGTFVGKASTASEAMIKADAFCWDK